MARQVPQPAGNAADSLVIGPSTALDDLHGGLDLGLSDPDIYLIGVFTRELVHLMPNYCSMACLVDQI